VVRLLAVSGSLRSGSSNSALLQAAALLLADSAAVTFYDGLSTLPAFNPDDDVEPPHDAVARWRRALTDAEGVLLSSPEYAHGVPGAVKNALDWVVGSGELMDKPIALLNPSPQSTFAHPQLAETLTVMSARVVPDASITVAIPRRGATAAELTADPAVSEPLRAALAALLDAIAAGPVSLA
jgi:NAD(P)H-dependent FMN reductase